MASQTQSNLAWKTLIVVLIAELLGGIAVVFVTAQTFPGMNDPFLALWVSVFLALVLSWIWVGATLLGAIRSKGTWVRGSAVTIHLLMFAAAIGVLRGILGTVPEGLVLLTMSLVGFVAAIIARPVEQPLDDAPAN